MMHAGMRIRVCVPQEIGEALAHFPPAQRSRVVSFLLRGAAQGVDLKELFRLRMELVRLGVLLNLSLRASGGSIADAEAVECSVDLIRRVTGIEADGLIC